MLAKLATRAAESVGAVLVNVPLTPTFVPTNTEMGVAGVIRVKLGTALC